MTTNDTLNHELEIPAGFVLVKRGGRPKKEGRDAAIFLAKFWRQDKFAETATQAEEWIVRAWEAMGKESSKGIGEPAHVRAAIKRARKNGLEHCILAIMKNDFCTAVVSASAQLTLLEGARVWIWHDGMPNALEAKVGKLKITIDPVQTSAVAAAVDSLSGR